MQELDREDWEDMWDYPLQPLVATRDKLIQFKILHRIYYTPQRLHRIYPTSSAACWRCSGVPAGFLHIFWDCPQIQEYWKEVTQFIHKLTTIPIPLTISVCLLGLVEQLTLATATRTLIGTLLFYARKAIVLKWKSANPPTLSSWETLINKIIPLYKATYLSRGCPQKFEKVWHLWTDSESTTDDQPVGNCPD